MATDTELDAILHDASHDSKTWPVNRLVVLLTPLVFAPLSGALSAWLVRHFPGLHVDQTKTLAGIVEAGSFVLGFVVAYAKAHHWLNGWQAFEARSQTPDAAPSVGHPDGDEYDANAAEDALDERIARGEVDEPGGGG